MLKRTKGRLLLTLLVVTGLAGTLNNSSVSQRERKYAVSLMKESKNDLLSQVKGLSNNQLNYKSPSSQLSIKKCLLQAAWAEKKLWQTFASTMKQPANPEKRSAIRLTDEQLINRTEEGTLTAAGEATFKQANAPWKTLSAALASFKNMRSEHIRYMKTSTEDLRNHVVATQAGWLDCYQYILILSAQSNRYIRQIEEIKADKNFPRK